MAEKCATYTFCAAILGHDTKPGVSGIGNTIFMKKYQRNAHVSLLATAFKEQ